MVLVAAAGWVCCVSRRRCGPEGLRRWAAPARGECPQLLRGPVLAGSCAAAGSVRPARGAVRESAAAGARRAQRALETVEKVLTK